MGRGKDALTLPQLAPYKTSTGDGFWFAHREAATDVPQLYKALDNDGVAPIARRLDLYKWPLPTQNADGSWTPGEWCEPEGGASGEMVFCQRGLHAFDGRFWPTWIKYPHIYAVEFDGPVAFDGDKWLGARARLLREVDVTTLREADLLVNLKSERMHSTAESRKDQFKRERVREIKSHLLAEFQNRYRVQTIEANKAALGEFYEEARKTAGTAAFWAVEETIHSLRRAANSLLRAEQKVARLFGKPEVRQETRDLAKRMTAIAKALPGSSWPRYASMPWVRPGEQDRDNWYPITDEDIKGVGERWYRDYCSRAKSALAITDAQIEAEWNSIPDDIGMEELAALLRKADETPQPRKRRGA